MKWYIAYVAISIYLVDCLVKFARPQRGYRCITATENYAVISNIPSHICTHVCMSRSWCFLVNYNFANSTCLLSEEACILIVKDETFRTSHLHTIKPPDECVYWTPMTEENRDRSISSKPCAESPNECQVGRLTRNSQVSTGKYQPHKPQIVAPMDGYARVCPTATIPVTTCKPEVLQVPPGCFVTWMPFNATTDPVPRIAVQGGYLDGGIRQFVMRVILHGNPIYGVYKDGFEGYVPHDGMKTFNDMELLVVF